MVCRFILPLKDHGALNGNAKIHYASQVHHDRDKLEVVDYSATLRPSSICLIVSIAALIGFQLVS